MFYENDIPPIDQEDDVFKGRERVSTSVADSSPRRVGLGEKTTAMSLTIGLIMVYMVMEYARPANPLFIPMVIAIILFIQWVQSPHKQWESQIKCYFVLLGVIAVMVPFATNNFSAFMEFRVMVVQLLCVSVPIMHFVNSLPKFALVINTILVSFVYVAAVAIISGGKGPGGHIGDENDVAIALVTFMPFAVVSVILSKSMVKKVLFGVIFGIMAAGVVASMSRGGFLGFAAMLLYGFWLSPQKLRTALIGLILALGLAVLAPEEYWTEMGTIGAEVENQDENAGTGALRRVYWAIARQMFYANPIFGVGVANFKWSVGDYQSDEQFSQVGRIFTGQECHSLYFSVLAELGLSGFVMFLLILWFNRKDLKEVYANTSSYIQQAKTQMLGKGGMFAAQVLKTRIAGGVVVSSGRRFGLADSASVRSSQGDLHDMERLLYYSHATEAGLIGFLVSGVFLSVFTYPHFWIITALVVSLKHILRKRIEEIEASMGLNSPTKASLFVR